MRRRVRRSFAEELHYQQVEAALHDEGRWREGPERPSLKSRRLVLAGITPPGGPWSLTLRVASWFKPSIARLRCCICGEKIESRGSYNRSNWMDQHGAGHYQKIAPEKASAIATLIEMHGSHPNPSMGECRSAVETIMTEKEIHTVRGWGFTCEGDDDDE